MGTPDDCWFYILLWLSMKNDCMYQLNFSACNKNYIKKIKHLIIFGEHIQSSTYRLSQSMFNGFHYEIFNYWQSYERFLSTHAQQSLAHDLIQNGYDGLITFFLPTLVNQIILLLYSCKIAFSNMIDLFLSLRVCFVLTIHCARHYLTN